MRPKVVLLNLNNATPIIPPVAFDHLLPYLRGCEVAIFDLAPSHHPIGPFFQALTKLRPDTVFVTLRNVDTALFGGRFLLGEVVRLVKRIRKQLKESVFVAGGPAFTLYPELLMELCGFDYGVLGDGEVVTGHLARGVHQGAGVDIEKVPGLVFWKNREVVSNEPKIHQLGEFLQPVRLKSLYESYLREGIDIGGGIETKRGCNGHCIYCVEPYVKGREVRLKEPQQVLEEIQCFLKIGIRSFMWLDSEFNNPEEHAIEVMECIERSGLGGRIEWRAYARPKNLSKEFFVLAKRTGCFCLDIDGISADDEQIARMGGEFMVDDVVSAAHMAKKNNVPFVLNYLLGGPGDTVERANKTIEFFQRLGPKAVAGTVGIRVYPHTPLHEIVVRAGDIEKNPCLKGYVHNNSTFYKPVFYIEPSMRRLMKKT